jgi:hypothetical protein
MTERSSLAPHSSQRLKSNKTPVWIDDIVYTEDLLNAYHVTIVNKSTAQEPVPPFLFCLSTAGAPFFVNNSNNTHVETVD